MLKIVVNVNKQDVTYSCTLGQQLPKLDGKLVSIELTGKELRRLLDQKEIPVTVSDNAFIMWHGRPASRILKELREFFDN